MTTAETPHGPGHTLRNLGFGVIAGLVLGALLVAWEAISAYANMLSALF